MLHVWSDFGIFIFEFRFARGGRYGWGFTVVGGGLIDEGELLVVVIDWSTFSGEVCRVVSYGKGGATRCSSCSDANVR